MTITTNEGRSKQVYAALIDRVSFNYPLASLFTDMGPAMKQGESVDILTRSAITIQQASTVAGASASTMTVQTSPPAASNLVVDQHYGAIVEIPPGMQEFDEEGLYAGQMAGQVQTELNFFVDTDHWWSAIGQGAWDTTGSLWVNHAGATLTSDHIEQALATMIDQRGVQLDGCGWLFNPFGMGSVRRNSAWQPHENAIVGQLGIPEIGLLHGIPVYVTQSVPSQRVLGTTAAVVSGSGTVLTLTIDTSATGFPGHGIVPGMIMSTCTGLTQTVAANRVVASVTANTIVCTVAGMADATMADGVGTATFNMNFNGLLYRPWAFSRKKLVPTARIVPVSGGASGNSRITDELQSHTMWGRRCLPGAVVGLGSPRRSF